MPLIKTASLPCVTARVHNVHIWNACGGCPCYFATVFKQVKEAEIIVRMVLCALERVVNENLH